MTLYVGTSGWAYKEWKPDFYPPKLPAAKFLEHYAGRLGACEINATFYRLQSPAALAKWAASVPATFRFAVKAHRGITHGKALGEDPDLLDAFLRSLTPLGPALGVLLVQLPPYRGRDDAALERVLAAMPGGLPAAFEFRNASWSAPEVTGRIARAGSTLCLADTGGSVPDSLPEGRVAYVRLRAERYSEAAREAWRALLERESRARDVYAFAKHEGVPAGDPLTGVGLAVWLSGTRS